MENQNTDDIKNFITKEVYKNLKNCTAVQTTTARFHLITFLIALVLLIISVVCLILFENKFTITISVICLVLTLFIDSIIIMSFAMDSKKFKIKLIKVDDELFVYKYNRSKKMIITKEHQVVLDKNSITLYKNKSEFYPYIKFGIIAFLDANYQIVAKENDNIILTATTTYNETNIKHKFILTENLIPLELELKTKDKSQVKKVLYTFKKYNDDKFKLDLNKTLIKALTEKKADLPNAHKILDK